MYYSISGEFLRKMYHLLLAQVFYYDTRQLPNCYYSGLSNFNSQMVSYPHSWVLHKSIQIIYGNCYLFRFLFD